MSKLREINDAFRLLWSKCWLDSYISNVNIGLSDLPASRGERASKTPRKRTAKRRS